MKTQKLNVIVAIVCFLVGVSGAAMGAEPTTICSDDAIPVIKSEVVFGDVIVDGNCIIDDSAIVGSVIVNNQDNPQSVFVLNGSTVAGRVKVTGGGAVIRENNIATLRPRAILIQAVTLDTVVMDNLVQSQDANVTANIRVKDVEGNTASVLIYRNTVSRGNILCADNSKANTFALGNTVPRGRITCLGQ